MNRAVFLDRDGVINVDYAYVYKIEDFKFIDGIFEFCKYFYDKEYFIFVITNQSGIEKGFYTDDDLKIVHNYMEDEFLKEGIKIKKIYYVSTADSNNYFRKPNPGMVLTAQKEFNIDLENSILVGDRLSDIECGLNAGIGKSFLFKTAIDGNFKDNKKVFKINSFNEIINLVK